MIRKTLLLMMASVFLVSGLGIASAPKVEALGPGDPICRAVVIVDRSASVEGAGQVNSLTNALKNLPPLIDHSKINVAFWSFAGWSRYVSSDDNDWNINRYNQNFNWPWHGFVSTTNPAPGSWHNAVNTMKSYQGDTLFKRNTYYDWAMGYTNGGNGDLSSTAYNPQPNTALHNTGMPAAADVIVFTSDVEEGEPDQRGNERRIVAEKYLSNPNHPRTMVGVIIPAGRLSTYDNPVNLMVNGNRYDTTNVIRLAQNYNNFAPSVAALIKRGCDYRLTPTVQNVPNRMSPNQLINPVRGVVDNESFGRRSDYTEWHITRVSYPPSTITTRIPFNSLDGSSRITANASPCATATDDPINNPAWGLAGVDVDCNWREGSNRLFPRGDTNLDRNDNSPSAVGGVTCYFLSVNPTGWDEPRWTHSPLQCVMAAKSPVIKATGGDLRAITGPINVNPGNTLGSWVEYGVFSRGANQSNRIGSAGDYAGNTLTFSNDTTPLGNFWATNQPSSFLRVSSSLNALSGFSAGGAPPSVTLGAGKVKYGYGTTPGSLSITGSTGITGQQIIYAPGRTVTIEGNIEYSNDCGGSGCTPGNLPQVVIIARDIRILDGVERVDAWLVAQNSINTCYGATITAGPSGINTTNCGRYLQINGPVVTTILNAYRAGSPDIARFSDPVEIFNLRPDAYLWLYTQSNTSLKIHTNAIHELPPRY